MQGVGSCAASACHNNGEARGKKGSEYLTWFEVDPHVKARDALGKPESKRMHEIMSDAFPAMRQYKTASDNPLCLNCHSIGANVPERFHSDGIGCERCHGPAEKWRTTHYLDDFDRRTPGFVDTRCDLAARVYTCVKCHVGEANQEVDHVLIAAGHPRLRFEYGAYYANYPRHWAPLGEKDVDASYEAFTWALGQLVTARAGLELLISRASEPTKEQNWPEFAEFDCTACHHDLERISPRQQRFEREADAGIIPATRRAGQLPWGTWYYPMLPTLKLHVVGAPADESLEREIAALDHLMRQRVPSRETVARQAQKVMVLLDDWITKLTNAKASQPSGMPSFSLPRLKQMMRDVAGRNDMILQGWDGATQVYLGAASLNQAIGDSDRFFDKNQPLKEPLAFTLQEGQ